MRLRLVFLLPYPFTGLQVHRLKFLRTHRFTNAWRVAVHVLLLQLLRRCNPVPQLPSWPKVLIAAKTYGSVFYDKLSPSIARGKW